MAKLKIKAFQKKKQNKTKTRTNSQEQAILRKKNTSWLVRHRISSQPTDPSDTFDERKVPLTNSRCQQSGPLSQKDSPPHIQITLR